MSQFIILNTYTYLNDPLVFIQDPRLPHIIRPTIHSSISISQSMPSNPVPEQLQRYSPIRSIQLPCSQGLEAHSSISVSQYFPVYPRLHWHDGGYKGKSLKYAYYQTLSFILTVGSSAKQNPLFWHFSTLQKAVLQVTPWYPSEHVQVKLFLVSASEMRQRDK